MNRLRILSVDDIKQTSIPFALRLDCLKTDFANTIWSRNNTLFWVDENSGRIENFTLAYDGGEFSKRYY